MIKNFNSRKQGDAGVGLAIGYFTSHDYTVSIPLSDSQRYDLIIDDGKLHRVSVKTSTHLTPSGFYNVGLRTIGSNMHRTKIVRFDSSEVEILFVVCENGDMYCIPSKIVINVNAITLNESWNNYKV